MGANFLQPGVGPGLVGLLLIGLTLCYALRRSGSLGLCIGLHAGWVLAAKMSMRIMELPPGVEFPSGVGRRNFLVTRPEVWGSILVCWAVLWILYRRPRETANAEQPRAG